MNTAERSAFIADKLKNGYTHAVSYCPKGHDRTQPWPQLFFKGPKDAKLIAKEYQARGISAIWACLSAPHAY